MQEFCGTIGFVDQDRPRWSHLSYDGVPRRVVLQIGSEQHGWKNVGEVVFGTDGRKKKVRVDGFSLAEIQLAWLKRHRENGYPENIPLDRLSLFVARFASQLTDLGMVATCLEYPVQLPFDGDNILRLLEPEVI